MKRAALKTLILLLAITALCLSSCTRNATNVDIPTIEPQLVVQCFISPQDSAIKAYVSMSSPVFGNTSSLDGVTDATVKISDGVLTVPLKLEFSNGNSYYIADTSALKILAGKTYTLWVSTLSGFAAKASCTVPYPADTTSLKYNWDSTSETNTETGGIDRTIQLNMEWKDAPGESNYYRVGAFVLTYLADNPSSNFQEVMYNNANNDLITDKNNDGSILARRDLTAVVSEYDGGVISGFSFKPKGIKMYLLTCDVNYFKFHESADRNSNNNPFSEPTLIYTNIDGGLGCFGASNQFIKQVNF